MKKVKAEITIIGPEDLAKRGQGKNINQVDWHDLKDRNTVRDAEVLIYMDQYGSSKLLKNRFTNESDNPNIELDS